MPTRKLDQSRIELQAAESGNRAAQIAHDSRQNREQRNLDRSERAREFDEGINQRELDRWNQQWQERRRSRDARDRERAANQAAKPRTTNFGTEGTLDQAGGAPTDDPSRREQFDEQKRQFDTRTQMTAADKGLVQQTQLPGGAPVGGDNPRLAALQAQNQAATARGEQQMAQGIEQDGKKGFVKSASRVEQEKQAADMPRERALTARMNALERVKQNVRQYKLATAKFYAATSSAQRKEAQAEMEKTNKFLFQPIESTVKLMDALRTDKGQLASEWAALADMVAKDPKAGVHADTMREIETKTYGENLGRWLNQKLGAQGVKYAKQTGIMPDGTKVPYYTQGMQLLTKNHTTAYEEFSTGANAILLKRKMGDAQFNRMITELAADFAMQGKDLEQVFRDAGLTDEDVKNSAQRDEGPVLKEHRGTGQAAERGQITPAGAAAKGGTDFTNEPYPTAEPRKQARGPYVDLPGRMPLAGVQ
jgi:hypothetical protein